MGDHKTLTETPVGGKRRITEKVAVVGAAAALAAGAIAGLGTAPANATCVGFSGINIGPTGQCTTSLGTVAAVLGDGTAEATGFFTGAISVDGGAALADGIATAAWSGGTGSQAASAGILNWAVAQGTNVAAFAGVRTFDFLNFAFNFGSALDPLEFDSEGNPLPGAYSWVQASDGGVNLAGNLGGNASNTDTGIPTPLIVWAGGDDETLGFGTNAANVFGNRNDVRAIGTLLNATAWGNVFTFPNGSDNTVLAGDIGAPGFLAWAFSYQGIFTDACDSNCGNEVTAEGPGAIAGAIGVIRETIVQSGFGININNLFQPATTTVLAQQKSSGLVAGEPDKSTPKVFGKGTGKKAGSQLSESVTKAGKKLSSSVNKISAKLSNKGKEISAKVSKKGKDNVRKALGGSEKKKHTSEAGES